MYLNFQSQQTSNTSDFIEYLVNFASLYLRHLKHEHPCASKELKYKNTHFNTLKNFLIVTYSAKLWCCLDALPPRMLKIFAPIFLFRAFNALLIQTYFDPDEYWQSLEIAHKFTFGYGYETWEWKVGLRSFVHPAIFVLIFQIFPYVYAPVVCKVFMAAMSATTDLYTMKLARRFFGDQIAEWALLASLTSWFNFFCSTRSYSNTLESTMCIVALYYWPFPTLKPRLGKLRTYSIAICFAALSCVLRPTSAILWIFLGIQLLMYTRFNFRIIVVTVVTLQVPFNLCI